MTAVPDENVTTAISKDGDAEEGEDEDFEAEADDLGGNGGGDDDGGEARRVPATATAGDIPPPSLSVHLPRIVEIGYRLKGGVSVADPFHLVLDFVSFRVPALAYNVFYFILAVCQRPRHALVFLTFIISSSSWRNLTGPVTIDTIVAAQLVCLHISALFLGIISSSSWRNLRKCISKIRESDPIINFHLLIFVLFLAIITIIDDGREVMVVVVVIISFVDQR
ncbi:hypothetical protein TYRP_009539 [Tyrophagus putrescentiae]|nr:hypothetical protein TYRP_009539 [Tyrophagus putrescentiae]